jgi:hypothetical protein
MGNTQLARQYAQEAIESYKRLGMERSYKGLEKFMEEAQK